VLAPWCRYEAWATREGKGRTGLGGQVPALAAGPPGWWDGGGDHGGGAGPEEGGEALGEGGAVGDRQGALQQPQPHPGAVRRGWAARGGRPRMGVWGRGIGAHKEAEGVSHTPRGHWDCGRRHQRENEDSRVSQNKASELNEVRYVRL